MRRKLTALVCVLALLLALVPPSLAADQMYFVALNETIQDYSADTLPIKLGGTMYVPYTVFLSEFNGGVNLGVFYNRNKQLNLLSLYGRGTPFLTFNYETGETYDTMDNEYTYRAIVRNDTIYLPVWAVSDYFGLESSYHPTEFGDLIRIKKDAILSDAFLLSSATDKLREQRRRFDRDQAEKPAVTPSPAPSPTPTPGGSQRQIQVFLAFRCDTGNGPATLLDTLDRTGEKALFFFRPQDLSRWDDHIRRLLAQGHRVGLVVDGGDVPACEEQLAEGNRLLEHIARTRTDFVLVEGREGLRQELKGRGWACWTGNVSGLPQGERRGAALSANILSRIDSRRTQARVLMDDAAISGQALANLLPKLEGPEYVLQATPEGSL